ncbi:MAG TPA: hypothetical protein VN742_11930 [Candidatus Binataceae bacterium]|nr:hypothetical protein [Candidatus Binataceae bacterium]
MRRIAVFSGLVLLYATIFGAARAVAAAPQYKQGCVFHGWFVSGSTLTPFDAIIQTVNQYSTATSGNILSGEEIVNTGGSTVCTYTIVPTGSTFTINSLGITTFSQTFTPTTGNPAGCATTQFVATAQGVVTATGAYTLSTQLGSTGSGSCSLQ